MPLKSQLHNSVSSLHIGLAIVLCMISFMEVDCDIIDGSKSNFDAGAAHISFYEFEACCEDDNEEEEEQQELMEEDVENDEMLTDTMRQNNVQRELLEIRVAIQIY